MKVRWIGTVLSRVAHILMTTIGNTGSSRFRLSAKSLEDVPVPLSRLYDLAMGLSKQVFAKSDRLLDRAWAFDRPADCW